MTARCAKNRGRGRGFTLLELLVALALLGLIAIFSTGGIRLGARTWETVGGRAETAGRTQTVRAFLYRELAQIAPVAIVNEDGVNRPAFEGASDFLTFVAPLPSHYGLGGLQRMHIELAEKQEISVGKALIMRRQAFDPNGGRGTEAEGGEVHVLLEDIESITFAYFGSPGGEPPQWHDRWEPAGLLPELIRIRIRNADARTPVWPDLLVPRRITADQG